MNENQLSEVIIGCAIKVHKQLRPGLLESVYTECLLYELMKLGVYVQKQKPLPLIYYEVKLECGYRADIVVENKVVIDTKSVEALNEIHFAHLLIYLKLSHCKLGLLINFNVRVKEGIKRVVRKHINLCVRLRLFRGPLRRIFL